MNWDIRKKQKEKIEAPTWRTVEGHVSVNKINAANDDESSSTWRTVEGTVWRIMLNDIFYTYDDIKSELSYHIISLSYHTVSDDV